LKANNRALIFGNGARSSIVLGNSSVDEFEPLIPLMTGALSNRQTVTVPLSTRTNRRLKRSFDAAARSRGNRPAENQCQFKSPHGKENQKKIFRTKLLRIPKRILWLT
jgi:hypothetical protein